MTNNIIEVNSENFIESVVKASEKLPVVVDFWAPWCGPCKQLTPILEKEIKAFQNKIILAKINIDENQAIASQMQIQSIPMVYAFFKGQAVDGFQGNIPESQIIEFLKKISELNGPSPDVKDKLEKLEESLTHSDWNELLETANSILDLDSNNVEACYGKIMALIGLNNFKEAREFMSILPEQIMNEKKINELTSKINVQENSFNANKNFAHFENIVKKNPNDIKAKIELSNALYGAGRISDCYELLIKAIKLDPNWNDQEARKKLLSFISAHDLNSEEAKKARRQLSSILFS